MFGELLRTHRKAANFSQQQLASDSKVTKSAISHYENSRRVPTLSVVERLATKLGLDAELKKEFIAAALAGIHEIVQPIDKTVTRLTNYLFSMGTCEQRNRLAVELNHAMDSWSNSIKSGVTKVVIPVAGWQVNLLSSQQTNSLVEASIKEARKCRSLKDFIVVVAESQRDMQVLKKAHVRTVVQKRESTGLANAVRLVRQYVERDEAFVLVLPDDRVKPECIQRLTETHKKTQSCVLSVKLISKENRNATGIKDFGGIVWKTEPHEKDKGVRKIIELDETPQFSSLDARTVLFRILGRYVLTPSIFPAIENLDVNPRTGRLELTDALKKVGSVYQMPYSRKVESISSVRKMLESQIRKMSRF